MTPSASAPRLDEQLCFALYSASRAVTRAYAPLLAEAGLTYPQFVTLLALYETPDAPRSVGELARRLHLDGATMTPLLKRLETMGLVRRERDAADDRRVLVTLTAAGRDLEATLTDLPDRLAERHGTASLDVCGLRDELAALVTRLERAEGPAA